MRLAGIRPSPASWVPTGAWLAPGYAEWQPPAALRGPVACLWMSVIPDRPRGSGLILPDGCSDLIWEQGAGAWVAGPDTGPYTAGNPAPGAVIVGIRFRPAAGGLLLGLPLSELRDRRVPLDDVLAGQHAATRLSAGLRPADAAARLLDLTGKLVTDGAADPAIAHAATLLRDPAARLLDLTSRLVTDGAADPAIAHAATLLRDPAARTEEVAALIGLSERQLRRRSQAAVGYGPKTLQRVLRFQRFVRLLDASPDLPDLAGAAARTGYADQPHLTRECRALSGHTPAALHRLRRPV
jgi:AraC-like DNA-binding protein